VVSDAQAEVRIGVRDDFFHAANAVHGSIYFKCLDDAAFFAVSSVVEDHFVLTATFNIYLLRPVNKGQMIATGRVVHKSTRLFVAEAEVVDDAGHVLARGSGSFLKSPVLLSPELGYK